VESGSRRHFHAQVLALSGLGTAGSAAAAQTSKSATQNFDVRDFGATGDGTRLDTVAIQKAIDVCAQAGGGAVVVPRGIYRIGSIQLRSRVTLRLQESSRLTGSTDLRDYPAVVCKYRSYTDNYTDKSLIYGEDLEYAAIEGSGVIDGRGAAFNGPYKVRPYLMRFVNCRNLTVRDVTLLDSPMWVQHYLACDDLRLTGLKVRSRVNHNNDGIDIDSCQRVVISDCNISSGDDAICLKSTSDRPCRDIAITNCVVSSRCNGIKAGTESNGGFENIAISNCTIYDTNISGIALELVDGGTLDGVTVSNIMMRNVKNSIFVRLGNRARVFLEGAPKPAVGKLGNITIQSVHASGGAKAGCIVAGLPGHPITGITLRDISITCDGGGTRADANREIPEVQEKYPEYPMFGLMPASGVYIRHAKTVCLDNVQAVALKPDQRPLMVCDDVDGLDISRIHGRTDGEGEALIRFRDVRGSMIRTCRAAENTPVFLRVQGARSERILLSANDLSAAKKHFAIADDVAKTAVRDEH
jgi:polygalacturonase